MNMCPKSLTCKMKTDTIKCDRSKVFRKNRKVLNVPVKRYIYWFNNHLKDFPSSVTLNGFLQRF